MVCIKHPVVIHVCLKVCKNCQAWQERKIILQMFPQYSPPHLKSAVLVRCGSLPHECTVWFHISQRRAAQRRLVISDDVPSGTDCPSHYVVLTGLSSFPLTVHYCRVIKLHTPEWTGVWTRTNRVRDSVVAVGDHRPVIPGVFTVSKSSFLSGRRHLPCSSLQRLVGWFLTFLWS